MPRELFEAIEAGDLEGVKAIVGEHPELASDRNDEGVSAVLAAQYRGQQDITELLVTARGDLDVFEAAAVGDTDRLLALINESRSIVNAWSADGYTPLHLAALFGPTTGLGLGDAAHGPPLTFTPSSRILSQLARLFLLCRVKKPETAALGRRRSSSTS